MFVTSGKPRTKLSGMPGFIKPNSEGMCKGETPMDTTRSTYVDILFVSGGFLLGWILGGRLECLEMEKK